MLGRRDGTLNPNGIRFGSAEIYNIVETFPEVQDSLCVAQLIELEERVVLFLKMVEGHSFSQDLVSRVKAAIRTQLSVRHVPGVVLETTSIPVSVHVEVMLVIMIFLCLLVRLIHRNKDIDFTVKCIPDRRLKLCITQ
ncbi:acetoacetyl-CoA synthetase-like [Corticium candelabrum]|uniref:acetoacetyl-CoA synthetase-like n=1 Tax=Corticium candelabrum TaxID=121492 RepID=UPI002E25BEB6|nr:acetoacetyl-CoA synthetase-like [Corticium candelabrum]